MLYLQATSSSGLVSESVVLLSQSSDLESFTLGMNFRSFLELYDGICVMHPEINSNHEVIDGERLSLVFSDDLMSAGNQLRSDEELNSQPTEPSDSNSGTDGSSSSSPIAMICHQVSPVLIICASCCSLMSSSLFIICRITLRSVEMAIFPMHTKLMHRHKTQAVRSTL